MPRTTSTRKRIKRKRRKTTLAWRTLYQSYVFKTPWLWVKKERVLLPSTKRIINFFSVDGKQLVAIIVLNTKGNVLLVRQYRQAIKKITIDLPGGSIEKGESPIEAARRELLEETGYQIIRLKKILTYYPDSGKTGDVKHIFFTVLRRPKPINPRSNNETEVVAAFWMPLQKLLKSIKKGQEKEATLLLGLLYYAQFFNKKRDNDRKT